MNWFHDPLIETFGKTLINSLWQLSVIAAIVTIVLFLMRNRTASARYIVSLVALLLMTATPVTTYLYLRPTPARSQITDVVSKEKHVKPIDQAGVGNSISFEYNPATSSATFFESIHALLPVTVAAYLLGAFFFTFRLVIGYLRVCYMPRGSSQVGQEVHELMLTLCHRLAISRPVKLLKSAAVEVPTVLGVLHPIILVPASAISGMPVDHLINLLAHELAHIRRHDYLINIFQSVIETLLFYHPAVWWLSARIRQEREHCCDDVAIALSGNRLNYAQALAAMESLRPAPDAIPSSLVIGARTGALLPRIRRVLRIPSSNDRSRQCMMTSALSTLSILIALAYVLGCSQQDKMTSTSSTTAPAMRSTSVTASNPIPFGDKPLISLRTDIMAVDDSTLQNAKQLLFPLHLSFEAAEDAPKIIADNNAQTIIIPSSNFELAQFIVTLRRSKTFTAIANPGIVLLSGQKGVIQIGQRIPYISGYKLSDPKNPKSTLVPDVTYVEPGFSLPISATFTEDKKNALIDFNLTVTSILRIDPVPATKAPFQKQSAIIQSPVLDVRTVASKIVIPHHRSAIIFVPDVSIPSWNGEAPDNTHRRLVITITSDIIPPQTRPATKN